MPTQEQTQTGTMHTVSVPLVFWSDHEDRDLPTPEPTHRDGGKVVIPLYGHETDELLADAEHYAHRDGPGSIGLKSSARATVKAITEARSKNPPPPASLSPDEVAKIRAAHAGAVGVSHGANAVAKLCDSHADLQTQTTAQAGVIGKMREALTKCDRAFAAWQVGQIPGRPEDILALIVEVRAALLLAQKGGMAPAPVVEDADALGAKDEQARADWEDGEGAEVATSSGIWHAAIAYERNRVNALRGGQTP